MHHLKLAGLGLVFAAFAFSAPASARMMKNGEMFMVGSGGQMKDLGRMERKKIEEMIKGSEAIGEDMVIFAWGGKFYMMKNHKMDNGQMSFDYFGIHGR